ncbi:MAG: tetratricopeptide repeat protein [Nitrospirota bacterium]
MAPTQLVSRRPAPLAAWLSLIVFGVALYLPSLRFASFHYDDANVIVENPAVHSLRTPSRFFTDGGTAMATAQRHEKGDVVYRPLLTLSFALDYALWGLDGRGYRATNLVVHLATALIAFGLAQRLGVGLLTAWLVATAMLIHPVHVQIVDYVSARSSGLSGALTLGTAWAYAAFRRGGSPWSYPLALGLGCAALLTKEPAAALPALLLLTEAVGHNRGWRDIRWRPLVPFILLVIAFVWIRSVVLHPFSEPDPRPDRSGLLGLVWTAWRLAAGYVQLWVFPWPLSLDHPFAVTEPGWDLRTFAAMVVLLAAITMIAWGVVSGHRVWAFGPLWFVMAVAPSCVLPWITTRALLFEQRAYAADFGLALLTALTAVWLLERLQGVRRVAVVAVTVAVYGIWAVATVVYAETWKTPLTAWEHAAHAFPDSVTAQYNFGVQLRAVDRNDEALEAFEQARALNPLLKDIHRQIEAIRQGRGGWVNVITEHEALVREDPSREFAWFNLGVAYQKVGEREQALKAYRKALALRPSRVASHINLGAILVDLGRTNEAIEAFQGALVVEPSSIMARYNLAAAYRGAGRREDAKREYETLLKLLPDTESGEGFRASVEIAIRELNAERS